MSYLDEGVLTEILKRLPVKSLLRFKCVNRRWNCMISDPEFARAHLPEKLLVRVDPSYSNRYDRVDEAIFTELNIWPNNREEHLSIHGSCHGLVCLLRADDRRHFYLYNPATRQLRQLPKSCKRSYNDDEDGKFLCGFGYDTVKDDYKILVSCMHRSWCKQIYSLRSNSWRSTAKGNQYSLQGQGMYSDGFLHWAHREREVDTIVSFDLATEEFREAFLPVPSFRLQDEGMQLSVTGGGSLVAYRIKVPRVEAWIMKGRGLNSTWTELCSFSSDPWMTREGPWNQHDRIYPFVKDGRTLLCVRRGWDSIDIYDPKDGSLIPFPIKSYQSFTAYVESLVSAHVANRPLRRQDFGYKITTFLSLISSFLSYTSLPTPDPNVYPSRRTN